MSGPLGEISTGQFLRHFWQKKPCLIRRALPGFEPPLDGNDLAGLACDELAESRLVSGRFSEQNWELRHGPFEVQDFSYLPESGWTLLVQDVEKHYPPLLELMERFNFIPSWRLDDLMVSYAVKDGSVGPHADQYDVFLYQSGGRRRWQIAEEFDPELLADCPLNVLRNFEPGQEWILDPGDMLYLPPNVAHHGVALEEGMTWSVGLRAPSTADLMLSMGEYLAAHDDGGPRYADPDLQIPARSGEIDADAIARMRDLITGFPGSQEAMKKFFGEFITRFRLAREPVSPDPDLDSRALLSKLQGGFRLFRNPWTRLAWTEAPGGALLFAAGYSMECSIPIAQLLCSGSEPDLSSTTLDVRDTAALLTLVNGGHFILSNDWS